MLVCAVLFASCSQIALLHVNNDQFLLQKNNYKFADVSSRDEVKQWQYELDEYTKQKPNSRTIWLPVRLWLYNAASFPSRDTSKIRRWAIRKGGEPPVISDTFLLRKSAISMRNYLYLQGYFNAKVTYKRDTTILDKLRKRGLAAHNYTIKLNKPYTLDSLSVLTNNPDIEDLIRDNTSLKRGTVISQKNFEHERTNIARMLKNNGYFYVAPSSIAFEGDTVRGLPLSNVRIKVDTMQRYYKYALHNVKVYGDIDAHNPPDYDTIINYQGIDFYERKQPFLKRKILERFFYFEKNTLFKIDDFDKTLKRLREIGIYKFTEIKFDNADSADIKRIDCTIRLTPAKRWDGGIDFDVRNSVFNNEKLNVAVGPSFRNRNTFGGAEQLNILMEVNSDLGISVATFKEWDSKKDLNFHSQAELILPRLYIPFIDVKDNEVRNRAKTRYAIDYNKQNAFNISNGITTEFRSETFSASAGWDWYEVATKRHQYNPIFVALQNIKVSQNLIEQNEFLKKSLADQYIIGSNYTFTYTPVMKNKTISWVFKGGLDDSGNLTWLLGKTVNKTIKIDTTPIAQFVRIEPDIRIYRNFNKNLLAFRFAAGFGLPYGNSEGTELPFSKQFFVGGANSIRAWNIRRIGPGASPKAIDAKSGYQTGDSKLEMSLEYRMPLTQMFKLAAFIDAGNVWSSSSAAVYPNKAKFNIGTFWDQLAVGAGIGLRLDFSYFLVRGDFAWAVRYPYLQRTTFDANNKYADEYIDVDNAAIPLSIRQSASHWRQLDAPDWFGHLTSPFFNLALNYPF
ncbi:MAG: hypothetical protein RI894_1012 [Bacteroidota bacterium]